MDKDPLSEVRSAFLNALVTIPPHEYVQIAKFDDFPGTIYFHVHQWSEAVFRDQFGPFETSQAITYSYYPSKNETEFDIIYRHYSVNGMGVDIKESSLFMVVFVKNIEKVTSEKDKLDIVAEVSRILFKTPENTRFKWIPAELSSQVFSSNQDKTYAGIGSWENRIDGFVRADGIEFIIYKEHLSIPPHDDAAHWIPEEFRKQAVKR
jgi:hypothetical protein